MARPKTKQTRQRVTVTAIYCQHPDLATATGRCGQTIVEIVVDAYDKARVTHVCEGGHRVVVLGET